MCGAVDFVCKAKEGLSDAAGSVVKEVAQSLGEGAMAVLRANNMLFFAVPDPKTNTTAITALQGDLGWYVGAFALLGFFFALAKMVLSQDFKTLIGGVAPIVKMIIVSACYATGVAAVMTAGTEFGAWIMFRASGQKDLTVLGTSMGYFVQLAPGPALLMTILMFVGSLMTALLMILRNALIPIMLVLLPVLAASSGTEAGKQAFSKANGWLLALLLYKPVACIILAVGLYMLSNDKVDSGEKLVDSLMSVGTGLLILVLAGLAMPALIKFLVPVAAQGSAGFSGGAAVAGAATVAAGAAMIAATGGAGAAAGGAGAAGAGAGSAGTGAGAAGAGAGSAGTGAGSTGGAQTAAGSTTAAGEGTTQAPSTPKGGGGPEGAGTESPRSTGGSDSNDSGSTDSKSSSPEGSGSSGQGNSGNSSSGEQGSGGGQPGGSGTANGDSGGMSRGQAAAQAGMNLSAAGGSATDEAIDQDR